MNKHKRILSLFLAILMILSVFPTSLFAAKDEVKTKTEVVKSYKEGDKLVFDVLKAKNPRRYNQQAQGGRFFASGPAATIDQKVTVSLRAVGLNEGGKAFDWSSLPSGLKVTVYFTDQGGTESERQEVTLTQTNSSQEVTLKVPATGGTGKLHAEIPDIGDNLAIRVIRSGESTADTTVGKGDWSFTVSVSEITSPVISLEVKDPYGKPATAAGAVKAKLHVDGLEQEGLDIPFTISQGDSSFNLKKAELLNGDYYDLTELNYPGADPILTVEGETQDNKLTLGTGENAVEYKVTKTYTIEDGGTITLTSQPKVIVPTPDANGDLPGVPANYNRVIFDPTAEGTITGKQAGETKLFDVLEGTTWDEAKAATPAVAEPGDPTPTDDTKNFVAWKDNDGKGQKLSEKTGTDTVAQTTFTATYSDDIVPQKPGEEKPDVPDNFVLVEFLPGTNGNLEGTTKYWVNPDKVVDLTEEAPEVIPTGEGVEHQGWDKALNAKFASGTKITATYKTTKTETETIKAKVKYEADDSLDFEEKVVDKAPVDGEKKVTTVSQPGKDDVVTEEVTKEAEDGITKVGNKKVETKTNDDGSTTTTTTTYDVDPETGKLSNPQTETKTTMPAGTIEDIAKTTKVTTETVPGKVKYVADDSLDFKEKKEDKAPVDGEKKVTTVSQPGKDDVVTEEVTKEAEDGITKVGNKKVETKTNDDGSTTTTTTTYDVDPETGKLSNPQTETKTTNPETPEDKKTTVDNSNPTEVNPTDDKQGTGIKVTNPDDNTKVTVTDEDGTVIPSEINPTTGEIEVTPGTNVDGPLSVKVEDNDLDEPLTTEVKVKGHEKDKDDNGSNEQPGTGDEDKTRVTVPDDLTPVKPTNNPQDTGIKVENKDDDTKISAKDEDGKDVPVEIDENGKVIVKPGEDVDGPITVVIEDKDLPGGKTEVEVEVNGHKKGQDDNNNGEPSGNTGGTVTPGKPSDDDNTGGNDGYRPGHGGSDVFDRLFRRHDYTPTYPVKTVVPEKTEVATPVRDTLWYVFHINEFQYEVVRNGVVTKRLMDVTPVIQNGRTVLPLRYVAEALQADVTWDAKTRTATFTKDGLTASIQIDSDEIVLSNGKTVKMDSKPLNINDRILVSVTNVANVFGLTNGNTKDNADQDIEWEQQDKSATIYIRR